jgi:hypothetical protein
MSISLIAPGLVLLGLVVVLVFGLMGLFKAFYKKVDQGTALIVNDMSSQPKVHFTGALIVPVLYRAELMKISLITLQVDRRGKEGLICKDNMRADITVAFYLRVNETQADVLRVAKAIGADRASDKNAVERTVQRQVLRGAEDRRQEVRLHRAVREAPGIPRRDRRGHRQRPQRLRAGGRRDRLPGADAEAHAGPEQHPRRPGHPQDHRADRRAERQDQRAGAATKSCRSPRRTSRRARGAAVAGTPAGRSRGAAEARDRDHPCRPASRPRPRACARNSAWSPRTRACSRMN